MHKRDWKLCHNSEFHDHQATDGSKTGSLNIRGSKVGHSDIGGALAWLCTGLAKGDVLHRVIQVRGY